MKAPRKRQNPPSRRRSAAVSQRFLGHRTSETDLEATIPVPVVRPEPRIRMDRPFTSKPRVADARVPFITPYPTQWSERAFVQQAQARPMRTQPRPHHWPWSLGAVAFFIYLATQVVVRGDGSSEALRNASLGVWSLYVVASATVLVLTWQRTAWPLIALMGALLVFGIRAPFVNAGFFAQGAGAAWYALRVPWWNLFGLTLAFGALRTRGVRTPLQLRALVLVQALQLGAYAFLVLMSVVVLGRQGELRASWAFPLVTLLASWWFQSRCIQAMRERAEDEAPRVPRPTALAMGQG